MNIEDRVSALEKTANTYRGAFIVAGIALSAFFGVTYYVAIPQAAKKSINELATKDVQRKLDEALETANRIVDGKPFISEQLVAVGGDVATDRELALGKHRFCALSEVGFNKISTPANKHCVLSQKDNGEWTLLARAEPGHTTACRAACLP